MKKPKLQVESPQPRQVQRADLAPTTGYAIVVDGRFKTEFDEEKAAKKAAIELLAKYPMLRIEIYNASSKSRIPVK
jgi:recombinational DNA repair protein RecT